ncbi:response regulator [Ovoidimarina sediminis]|uniref:response regulator n=1 Tax=Ovoidimarina sediminis TaxID=3079856 RepID=UPI0029072332|nr:response regulator [Rhodophyticola sp. MJ-SS7]MDU8946125.1 response regulator [Rhodophyticola sp. MJ-SS7]
MLHIDDDERIRDLVALAMELNDEVSLIQAANGTDGLRLARQLKPDLILLDFMMPGLSGEDVITEIHASPEIARIPVVFMTARTTQADDEFMMSLGARDVIRKPFDPFQLPERVSEFLTVEGIDVKCA